MLQFISIQFYENKVTPILRVIVCPSLKPRSSLGVESGACACLENSFSCFTHLEKIKDTFTTINEFTSESGVIHDILWSSYILEVVLQCNIEVKGIASVSKPNAYEGTAAYERNEHNRQG